MSTMSPRGGVLDVTENGTRIVEVDGDQQYIQKKRWERLKKMASDMIRKRYLTNKEWADKYGISERQVYKDKNLIRKLKASELYDYSMMEYVSEMHMTKDLVVQEYWELLDDIKKDQVKGNPFARIKTLSKIAEMDRKYFNIVRDLGFMSQSLRESNEDSDRGRRPERLIELLEGVSDEGDEEEVKEVVTNFVKNKTNGNE